MSSFPNSIFLNSLFHHPLTFRTNQSCVYSVLLAAGVLYVVTWILALIATTPTLLYTARFLAGMGKGVAFTVAPVYLGEIASTPIRGAISTMFAGLLWAGTMFEYTIGPYVGYDTLLWMSLTMPIAFLATFFFMPESPYYLTMRSRYEDVRNSLNWLRNGPSSAIGDDVNDDPVEQEMKDMEKSVTQDMQNKGTFSDLLTSPSNRKATVIVVVISMFQRTCGISTMLAYSSTTLPETGEFIGPEEIVLVFGFILTIFNFVATPLVDSLGRKPLLIFSGGVCGMSAAVSGVFYYLHHQTTADTSGYLWVPYVSLCVFGLAHSVGIGVIPHTLLAELYPQNVKRHAAATASITFAVSSFAINKVYTSVQMSVGVHAMFAFFALNGLVCALFSCFVVFETKGKTFAEIQKILHSKY